MKAPRPASDPDSSNAAYLLALRWLSGRELSEHQVRQRLERRLFTPDAIAEAIDRLIEHRTLDDHRTARAVARSEAAIRYRGSHRVLGRLVSIGIDRDLAREVIREVFGEIDEQALLERALAKRLRTASSPIRDAAHHRRLHAFLVRQGFPSAAVAALLRTRARKTSAVADD